MIQYANEATHALSTGSFVRVPPGDPSRGRHAANFVRHMQRRSDDPFHLPATGYHLGVKTAVRDKIHSLVPGAHILSNRGHHCRSARTRHDFDVNGLGARNIRCR